MIRLRPLLRRPGGAADLLPLLAALLLGGPRGARPLAAQHGEPGGAAPGPAAAEARPTATAFVHVNVVPMDRERVLADQTVVVRSGRIVALGPAATVRVPAGATRVDGRGRFLLPGLADMHVHLRGLRSAGDDRLAEALFAFLASGVTTIRDMHSGGGAPENAALGAWMLGVRARLARGALLGPRLYTAGDPDYASPAAAAASVAKLKADGHDFVKMYNDTKSAELSDSLKASATRVGLRMVGHVPVNELRWAIAAPYASIEHLMGYVPNIMGDEQDSLGKAYRNNWTDPKAPWNQPGYRLDATRLRELATATRRAGVWNCPTLRVSMKNLSEGKGFAFGDAYRPLAFQVVVGLHRAGAGLLSGTDVLLDVDCWGEKSPLPKGRTVADELALFVEAGLTPYAALQTSTSGVAAFLGTADSTGTVAIGKRADLVLLTGNPVRDIRQVAALAGVMAGGRWLPKAELDRRLAAVGQPADPATPRRRRPAAPPDRRR